MNIYGIETGFENRERMDAFATKANDVKICVEHLRDGGDVEFWTAELKSDIEILQEYLNDFLDDDYCRIYEEQNKEEEGDYA
jgi:hypothetical protein